MATTHNVRYVVLLALVLLAGCEPVQKFKCVNGQLYKQWNKDTWVLVSGEEYPFHADGPMGCVP